VPRRILAALVAAFSLLLITPSRLSSEPARTTTTENFGFTDPAAPNPLTLYRGRPNAKYEDIEAASDGPIEMGIARLRVKSWAVQPNRSLPGLSVPADLSRYRKLRLVDGYEQKLTSTTGDILHAVVRMERTFLSGTVTCVATAAADGTVLVPYDRPPPKPRRSTSTTSEDSPVNIDLYFPLGAIRGRVYLTCRESFVLDTSIGEVRRAVWGLDV
jgi:hypothetical protein